MKQTRWRVGALAASVLVVWSAGVTPASTAAAPTPAFTTSPASPAQPMSQTLFDFADPNTAARWFATDDRVMGGVSRSRMRADATGAAVFEGVMSLEQNGGFASVRAESVAPALALNAKATHYVVDVRGDGKRYKLILRMAGRASQVSYQATFQTEKDVWTTIALPVKDFEASFRGRRVVNAPSLDPALVDQVGLMISDKQDGAFQLAIRRIAIDAR